MRKVKNWLATTMNKPNMNMTREKQEIALFQRLQKGGMR